MFKLGFVSRFFFIRAKKLFILSVPNFLIFSNNFFRNELHSPFLPYFDTQHLICKKLIMFIGGSQNCNKKNEWYLKIISIRVCKKIFLIRAKKNSVLGVPKFRTKAFIFEYFPKIPSEMNSTHPFYTFLIPMTSHAKKFILFIGGPQGVPEP